MPIICYTIKQVSEMLGVHPDTVRREIQKGFLQAKKIGTDYRISELAYNDYINADVKYTLDTIQKLEDEVQELTQYRDLWESAMRDMQKTLGSFRDKAMSNYHRGRAM